MSSLNFSNICGHNRLKRMDKNFVRCLDCGLSIINQSKIQSNKTPREFAEENKSVTRNFDRNFTNILEEIDEQSNVPFYEYYSDRLWNNLIKYDRTPQFSSDPVKYKIFINGHVHYLMQKEIDNVLSSINAIRIDEDQYNRIKKKLNKN
ncbi:hypothetical protein QLL95_gp1142 [Cotonvirus japonicus]|uniref:Uncharacterized protein n=1 Tax=Cotonvirus japonicus TaxID=2811091 RepID=A0ABM7NS63_9VIRU|nr:hypothetical protein QLL95_gp1142 [Cotonvirus japonicus]BCS82981.1 hypothetical protein [Cotonvirus japonicus]